MQTAVSGNIAKNTEEPQRIRNTELRNLEQKPKQRKNKKPKNQKTKRNPSRIVQSVERMAEHRPKNPVSMCLYVATCQLRR